MNAALESVITVIRDWLAEVNKCSMPASLKQDSVLALPAAWVMLPEQPQFMIIQGRLQ